MSYADAFKLPRHTYRPERAKAINAVKRMQETSVSLGNDEMTIDEINAAIADVRKNQNRIKNSTKLVNPVLPVI